MRGFVDRRTELKALRDRIQRPASIFVECKWRSEGVVDLNDLNRLRGHVARLPRKLAAPRSRLCLATAGRFADRLRRVPDPEGIVLLSLDVLLPQ